MGMMDDIRSALSDVGQAFADSGSIEYRHLTSAPNAVPRTHDAAWSDLSGSRIVNASFNQMRNEETGIWYVENTCELRIPANLAITLVVKDQVRIGGSDGQIWSVRRNIRSGAGSMQAYELAYSTPMLMDPRPGGV